MKYLLLILLCFSCTQKAKELLNQKDYESKWVLLASDISEYSYGLLKYEDKDVTCYTYKDTVGTSLHCLKK